MEEVALLTNLLADCSKIEKTILYKVTINVLLLSKNYAIITKLSETSSSYFISFFPRKIVFAKSEEEMEKMDGGRNDEKKKKKEGWCPSVRINITGYIPSFHLRHLNTLLIKDGKHCTFTKRSTLP